MMHKQSERSLLYPFFSSYSIEFCNFDVTLILTKFGCIMEGIFRCFCIFLCEEFLLPYCYQDLCSRISIFTMTDGVSCVRLDDLIEKNYVHIAHTWRAWHQYVSDDAGSIHRTEQIAIHNPPMSTDKVSRLQKKKKIRKDTY